MSVVYALLLFGCADDGSACERLSTANATYQTIAACRADQERVLGSDIALSADFPSVETRCVATSVLARGSAQTRARTALAR